jgi:hypothetical protein
MELMPNRKELHLTVTSDSYVGFDEMLELALKELRRHAKSPEEPGKINQGNAAGTVGSYTFEIFRGDPKLCILIREFEADGFYRASSPSGFYYFENRDGRRKEISTLNMTVQDLKPFDSELIKPLLGVIIKPS